MSDPNTEAREIIHAARMATTRAELWAALVNDEDRDPLEIVAAALEQAGRALEQEREKMRIKDEALDFIAVVNDALPARKYAERTIELMRRRAREALASSPGAAAEAPGACSECGVPPGEPHREACFFLTGDPADLLEKRAGG